MTAYAGGPQIQNYLDPNRPDYGGIVLSGAESSSALERALMKLNSEVAGAELMSDARVKAAKMGAADASRVADAGVFAAGIGALGQAASGFIGAIPTGAGKGFEGLGGFGPVADSDAYGGFLDATAGTSGMGPLRSSDIYGSFLKRKDI